MMDRNPSPLRPPFTPFRVDSSLQPIDRDLHPVIHKGRVAVITGAASGIGKAAAFELAKCVSASICLLPNTDLRPCRDNLRIALADVNEAPLAQVGKEIARIVGEENVLVIPTDVSKIEQVKHLKDRVFEKWGEVSSVRLV